MKLDQKWIDCLHNAGTIESSHSFETNAKASSDLNCAMLTQNVNKTMSQFPGCNRKLPCTILNAKWMDKLSSKI